MCNHVLPWCRTGLGIICDCDLALFLGGESLCLILIVFPGSFIRVNCNFYCSGFNKLLSKVSVPLSASLPISGEILNSKNVSLDSAHHPFLAELYTRDLTLLPFLRSAFLLKFLCSTLLDSNLSADAPTAAPAEKWACLSHGTEDFWHMHASYWSLWF